MAVSEKQRHDLMEMLSKQDIESLRAEMATKDDLLALRRDMVPWLFAAMVVQTTTLGLLFLLAR